MLLYLCVFLISTKAEFFSYFSWLISLYVLSVFLLKKIKLYNCMEGHKPWCTLESQRTTLQRQFPTPPPQPRLHLHGLRGCVRGEAHHSWTFLTLGRLGLPSRGWGFFLVFLRADLSWQVRRKGDGTVSTVVSFPTTGEWNGRPSRHSFHYPTEVNRGGNRASALRGTWRTRHEHGISSRTVFLKKANSKSHERKYESKPNWVHLQNNSYL